MCRNHVIQVKALQSEAEEEGLKRNILQKGNVRTANDLMTRRNTQLRKMGAMSAEGFRVDD